MRYKFEACGVSIYSGSLPVIAWDSYELVVVFILSQDTEHELIVSE